MFAIECSNPAATNALTGGTMARIRSAVVRALRLSQTARQTRALHRTPSATACPKPSSSLACAIAERRGADGAAAEVVDPAQEDHRRRRRRPDEVAAEAR